MLAVQLASGHFSPIVWSFSSLITNINIDELLEKPKGAVCA